jgi:EAL domain-containing protein (putative c-di-GMP-specific phosphodiesterase class I)
MAIWLSVSPAVAGPSGPPVRFKELSTHTKPERFGASVADQLVVEAIVGIARGLGKKTVAEFVVDQDMVERLRRSGINFAQGFHVGVPQPVVEIFGSAERPVPAFA